MRGRWRGFAPRGELVSWHLLDLENFLRPGQRRVKSEMKMASHCHSQIGDAKMLARIIFFCKRSCWHTCSLSHFLQISDRNTPLTVSQSQILPMCPASCLLLVQSQSSSDSVRVWCKMAKSHRYDKSTLPLVAFPWLSGWQHDHGCHRENGEQGHIENYFSTACFCLHGMGTEQWRLNCYRVPLTESDSDSDSQQQNMKMKFWLQNRLCYFPCSLVLRFRKIVVLACVCGAANDTLKTRQIADSDAWYIFYINPTAKCLSYFS
jgi:hypothetical protein